jgi:nitroreductase
MRYNQPVTDLIKQRYSCRTYKDVPIEEAKRKKLADFIDTLETGPFGAPVRFKLVAATEEDRRALRGLGTYGTIRNPTGFILGTVGDGEKNLEDFGYRMEEVILFATSIELGTCWLGGFFTKSSFAKTMDIQKGWVMPCVAATGYIAEQRGLIDRLMRRGAGSARRKPWDELFFTGRFGVPLSKEAAGAYAEVIEMVRLAPSASNKQPWRVIKDGETWHFYLQRTPGYGKGLSAQFMAADLQRVDMGIAMSHFEFTADELELEGAWTFQEPAIETPDERTEYVASWR